MALQRKALQRKALRRSLGAERMRKPSGHLGLVESDCKTRQEELRAQLRWMSGT